MIWKPAPDVKQRLDHILSFLDLPHILNNRLVIYRSHGSSGRAIARIWSLPTVWQLALNVKPHYVIEVISEKYDRLSNDEKDRTLIHELMHIPKTFSGALVAHKTAHHRINHHSVEQLFKQFLKNKNGH